MPTVQEILFEDKNKFIKDRVHNVIRDEDINEIKEVVNHNAELLQNVIDNDGPVSFTDLIGQPTDNTNLATALAAKQDLVTRTVSTTSTATLTPNVDDYDMAVITAQAAALAIAAPTGTPSQGQAFVFRIKDNGTARAITFNAIYRAIGSALPTTTTISKTLYFVAVHNSTDTKWDVFPSNLEV